MGLICSMLRYAGLLSLYSTVFISNIRDKIEQQSHNPIPMKIEGYTQIK